MVDTAGDTCLPVDFSPALSGEWMENEAGVFMSTIPKEVARAAAARVLG